MHTTARKATANDVAAIVPLWRELMELHAALDPQYRLAPDAAIQVEAHLRAELVAPAALCLVAERDSAIVGYCRALVRQRSPIFVQRAHGFISELHVAPACRRQGIGRELFQGVQRWLAGQGIHRLELMFADANQNSRAFWRSMGCEPQASLVGLALRAATDPE